MNLLDKLERKFGKFAIKGLMLHIVGLNLLVFFLLRINPMFIERLYLNRELILQGQVWRLVSYIIIPPGGSYFWILFTLYFSYLIGSGLEQEWGSFKFNLYYLVGMIAITAATFLTSDITSLMVGISAGTYLNLSLLLAFARIYPNFEMRLFFFIPIQIKYLAWFYWAFIGYTVVSDNHISIKIAAVVSVLNYFLFFGKDIVTRTRTRGNAIYRKQKYKAELPSEKAFLHKCTKCGITEKDNPNVEFRYCLSCEGKYEYCMDHIKDHEHIKGK